MIRIRGCVISSGLGVFETWYGVIFRINVKFYWIVVRIEVEDVALEIDVVRLKHLNMWIKK